MYPALSLYMGMIPAYFTGVLTRGRKIGIVPRLIRFKQIVKEHPLANSAQARKRARQNENRRRHNASFRSMVRTSIKKVVRAVDDKDYDKATEAYRQAVPVIDRMADKGIIHKNKAARHKSRLNSAIHALKQD